ncbi:hypothetical protein VTN96DRAFT_3842 [Rasamsonia emersonii]
MATEPGALPWSPNATCNATSSKGGQGFSLWVSQHDSRPIPGNPTSMIQAGAAVSYQHVNLVAAPDWDVGQAAERFNGAWEQCPVRLVMPAAPVSSGCPHRLLHNARGDRGFVCDVEDHCEHGTPGEPGRHLGWLISTPETLNRTLNRTLVERGLDRKKQPSNRWPNNYPELFRTEIEAT